MLNTLNGFLFVMHGFKTPHACRFLDIELEAQIGERGFWVYAILQFSCCLWICHSL